jgi:rhamnogalacturonan endolyase
LTVYAEGIFGQLEMDDVTVSAGDGEGAPFAIDWSGESHGRELWRIGTPDKVRLDAWDQWEPRTKY